MMIRFYLRLTFIPIVFFTVVLRLIPVLPYDGHQLRQYLLPEGCLSPCLMGIRPGITTMDEAAAILEANPWVGHIEKEADNFSYTINWTWSNRLPKHIIPTSSGRISAAQKSENPLVEGMTISNFLQLGEVYAALGQPDTETLNFAGYSIGERYAYMDYVAFYKKADLFFYYQQACRTGFRSTQEAEFLGVPFTMPVNVVMGRRFSLPISGQLMRARSPIHLHRACGT